MIVPLQGAQMLQMLEKSLRKRLPESLKVYGTIYHMNHGNPFKLKAVVDKWPDFNTVVVRPQEQDMEDDLDFYTNTYQIFSKDPQNCQEFLNSPGVINWKQHLQIQSSQSSLKEVIQNIGSAKSFHIKHSENILFVTLETIKKLFPALPDMKNLSPSDGKPKAINEDMFKLSSLDVTHAALDQVMKKHGFPVYSHTDKSNTAMQRMSYSLHHIAIPGAWNQWKCVPL